MSGRVNKECSNRLSTFGTCVVKPFRHLQNHHLPTFQNLDVQMSPINPYSMPLSSTLPQDPRAHSMRRTEGIDLSLPDFSKSLHNQRTGAVQSLCSKHPSHFYPEVNMRSGYHSRLNSCSVERNLFGYDSSQAERLSSLTYNSRHYSLPVHDTVFSPNHARSFETCTNVRNVYRSQSLASGECFVGNGADIFSLLPVKHRSKTLGPEGAMVPTLRRLNKDLMTNPWATPQLDQSRRHKELISQKMNYPSVVGLERNKRFRRMEETINFLEQSINPHVQIKKRCIGDRNWELSLNKSRRYPSSESRDKCGKQSPRKYVRRADQIPPVFRSREMNSFRGSHNAKRRLSYGPDDELCDNYKSDTNSSVKFIHGQNMHASQDMANFVDIPRASYSCSETLACLKELESRKVKHIYQRSEESLSGCSKAYLDFVGNGVSDLCKSTPCEQKAESMARKKDNVPSCSRAGSLRRTTSTSVKSDIPTHCDALFTTAQSTYCSVQHGDHFNTIKDHSKGMNSYQEKEPVSSNDEKGIVLSRNRLSELKSTMLNHGITELLIAPVDFNKKIFDETTSKSTASSVTNDDSRIEVMPTDNCTVLSSANSSCRRTTGPSVTPGQVLIPCLKPISTSRKAECTAKAPVSESSMSTICITKASEQKLYVPPVAEKIFPVSVVSGPLVDKASKANAVTKVESFCPHSRTKKTLNLLGTVRLQDGQVLPNGIKRYDCQLRLMKPHKTVSKSNDSSCVGVPVGKICQKDDVEKFNDSGSSPPILCKPDEEKSDTSPTAGKDAEKWKEKLCSDTVKKENSTLSVNNTEILSAKPVTKSVVEFKIKPKALEKVHRDLVAVFQKCPKLLESPKKTYSFRSPIDVGKSSQTPNRSVWDSIPELKSGFGSESFISCGRNQDAVKVLDECYRSSRNKGESSKKPLDLSHVQATHSEQGSNSSRLETPSTGICSEGEEESDHLYSPRPLHINLDTSSESKGTENSCEETDSGLGSAAVASPADVKSTTSEKNVARSKSSMTSIGAEKLNKTMSPPHLQHVHSFESKSTTPSSSPFPIPNLTPHWSASKPSSSLLPTVSESNNVGKAAVKEVGQTGMSRCGSNGDFQMQQPEVQGSDMKVKKTKQKPSVKSLLSEAQYFFDHPALYKFHRSNKKTPRTSRYRSRKNNRNCSKFSNFQYDQCNACECSSSEKGVEDSANDSTKLVKRKRKSLRVFPTELPAKSQKLNSSTKRDFVGQDAVNSPHTYQKLPRKASIQMAHLNASRSSKENVSPADSKTELRNQPSSLQVVATSMALRSRRPTSQQQPEKLTEAKPRSDLLSFGNESQLGRDSSSPNVSATHKKVQKQKQTPNGKSVIPSPGRLRSQPNVDKLPADSARFAKSSKLPDPVEQSFVSPKILRSHTKQNVLNSNQSVNQSDDSCMPSAKQCSSSSHRELSVIQPQRKSPVRRSPELDSCKKLSVQLNKIKIVEQEDSQDHCESSYQVKNTNSNQSLDQKGRTNSPVVIPEDFNCSKTPSVRLTPLKCLNTKTKSSKSCSARKGLFKNFKENVRVTNISVERTGNKYHRALCKTPSYSAKSDDKLCQTNPSVVKGGSQLFTLRVISKPNPTCRFCNSFTSQWQSEVQQHINQAHRFRCCKCFIAFSSREEKNLHAEKHVTELHYCSLCQRDLRTEWGYRRHVRGKLHQMSVRVQRSTFDMVRQALRKLAQGFGQPSHTDDLLELEDRSLCERLNRHSGKELTWHFHENGEFRDQLVKFKKEELDEIITIAIARRSDTMQQKSLELPADRWTDNMSETQTQRICVRPEGGATPSQSSSVTEALEVTSNRTQSFRLSEADDLFLTELLGLRLNNQPAEQHTSCLNMQPDVQGQTGAQSINQTDTAISKCYNYSSSQQAPCSGISEGLSACSASHATGQNGPSVKLYWRGSLSRAGEFHMPSYPTVQSLEMPCVTPQSIVRVSRLSDTSESEDEDNPSFQKVSSKLALVQPDQTSSKEHNTCSSTVVGSSHIQPGQDTPPVQLFAANNNREKTSTDTLSARSTPDFMQTCQLLNHSYSGMKRNFGSAASSSTCCEVDFTALLQDEYPGGLMGYNPAPKATIVDSESLDGTEKLLQLL